MNRQKRCKIGFQLDIGRIIDLPAHTIESVVKEEQPNQIDSVEQKRCPERAPNGSAFLFRAVKRGVSKQRRCNQQGDNQSAHQQFGGRGYINGIADFDKQYEQ